MKLKMLNIGIFQIPVLMTDEMANDVLFLVSGFRFYSVGEVPPAYTIMIFNDGSKIGAGGIIKIQDFGGVSFKMKKEKEERE